MQELGRIIKTLHLLRYIHDELESVQSYETDGERIVNVYIQRNPEKLRRVSEHRVMPLQ